jgi:hypothetical protein
MNNTPTAAREGLSSSRVHTFHTLRTKLGIKDPNDLKCGGYIQTEIFWTSLAICCRAVLAFPLAQEKKSWEDKEDTGKWCDFHKSPWHNTDECCSKQSLVDEIKDKEPNPDSESDSENTGKRQIIDADPTAIVTTATIQPEEPTDPEEGERLFHSQMWVKGSFPLLHKHKIISDNIIAPWGKAC